MNSAHCTPHSPEPTPVFAYVVEAWAVVATLAPALLAKLFLF